VASWLSAASSSDAAASPLADFNLGQTRIPAILLEVQKAPYLPPGDQSCPALSAEVTALDLVLGADLDVPMAASSNGTLERGAELIDDGAIGAFKGAVEGLVPYRGWVRRLSGAERYSREVAAAVAAGSVRRAFLKGLRLARGCF
ncbi:MAG: hypothetical protein WCH44_00610, partial [Betaproteobacteria bacterium]